MRIKIIPCWLLFWCLPAFAADAPKQTLRTVGPGDIANWLLGLLIVLSVFFLCVWAMRKLAGLSINAPGKMRVISGLSLGMREKIIVLQVGKKQLVLGITPGRIQTLHVLEGDDCLSSDNASPSLTETGFPHKLRQIMKGHSDA